MRSPAFKSICYVLPAIVAMVVTVLAVIFLTREPTHEGRSLSYWLDQLPSTTFTGGGYCMMLPVSYRSNAEAEADKPRVQELASNANEAVKRLGADHLDLLVARLKTSDSTIKLRLQRLALRFGMVRQNSALLLDANMRRGQALTAIEILGYQASPILPELEDLADNSDPAIKRAALHAMEMVGPGKYRNYNLSSAKLKGQPAAPNAESGRRE